MNLGYRLEPMSEHISSFYNCIVVRINARPTLKHFDPEWVSFPRITEHGYLDSMRISITWTGRATLPLAAGVVSVQDRKGKRVEFFSFGGQVELLREDKAVVLQICSDAPLLYLLYFVPSESTGCALATFALGQLARAKARWDDNTAFERHLATIQPLRLFATILQGFHTYLRSQPPQRHAKHYWRTLSEVRRELKWWQDHHQWNPALSVQSLLGCPEPLSA